MNSEVLLSMTDVTMEMIDSRIDIIEKGGNALAEGLQKALLDDEFDEKHMSELVTLLETYNNLLEVHQEVKYILALNALANIPW